MGNNIGTMCGYAQDKNELTAFNRKDLEKYKEEQNLKKVKAIQAEFRKQKSLKIFQENLEIFEKTFDMNLNTIGKFISEDEFQESINSKVKEIEKILGPITKEGNYNKKFMNILTKPPIKFNEEGTIYKGDWNMQGKKHGYGILVTKEGSKYEGFWKNDQLEGLGRFIEIRGNYYDGNWSNGMAHGHGTLHVVGSSKYVGNWNYDVQEGIATEYYEDGTIYSGEFKNGAKHGKGVMKWADGCYYEGDFENSFISGKGTYYWTDGRIYSGEWFENKMHGFGKFSWPDGKCYEGNYINDKKHGFGRYYWSPNVYYEGNWVNAKQHGIGTCYTNDRVIKGEFRSGRMIRIISEEMLIKEEPTGASNDSQGNKIQRNPTKDVNIRDSMKFGKKISDKAFENFDINLNTNSNEKKMEVINLMNKNVQENEENFEKKIDTKFTPSTNNIGNALNNSGLANNFS